LKIWHYFNTFELIRGFGIAILGSAFLYLYALDMASPILNTILGLLFFYFLLKSNTQIWFFSGFFSGIFWFWWISLSFIIYELSYLMPLALIFIGLGYAGIFVTIAYFSFKLTTWLQGLFHGLKSMPLIMLFQALGLLGLSYVHPLGFDWFKPELIFIESFIGITKWQFALVLFAIVVTHHTKKPYWLLITLLAYHPTPQESPTLPQEIALVNTQVSVAEKWNPHNRTQQTQQVLHTIDQAIAKGKRLIVFPESVLPYFINREKELMESLKKRAQQIHIVVGALFWDGKTPHNSTYIFTKEELTIAHKVVLVPFGESNPLPEFLSTWVNKVFYDGALDYIASHNVTDYTIDNTTYRNAICFEATSELLYNGSPNHLIVLSNNAWFVPSIEPALQQLLLLYYNQKYGTTIYHSVNMSPSYMVKDEKIVFVNESP
jgi:apolipoprotein N-acyltransferase